MIDESRACPSFSLTCAYTTLPGPWCRDEVSLCWQKRESATAAVARQPRIGLVALACRHGGVEAGSSPVVGAEIPRAL
jgi:hypothetical protein